MIQIDDMPLRDPHTPCDNGADIEMRPLQKGCLVDKKKYRLKQSFRRYTQIQTPRHTNRHPEDVFPAHSAPAEYIAPHASDAMHKAFHIREANVSCPACFCRIFHCVAQQRQHPLPIATEYPSTSRFVPEAKSISTAPAGRSSARSRRP